MPRPERDPPAEAPANVGVVPAPPHLSPRLLVLVFAGGMIGAASRFVLEQLAPYAQGGLPWVTFGINVAGAFALGLLLELLVRLGGDVGFRRAMRLALGTGILGSFTTYSALGTEAALLVRDGHAVLAAVYGFGSVSAGLLAAAAGIALVTAGASRAGGGGGGRPDAPAGPP